MEMMLAGVKSALTRQQFRVPQDLRNLAAAQEAIGWTHLFKGRISKQWINRQQDHIGDKATKKYLELGNHSDRLLLHTVVQGVGPEEPGPSRA